MTFFYFSFLSILFHIVVIFTIHHRTIGIHKESKQYLEICALPDISQQGWGLKFNPKQLREGEIEIEIERLTQKEKKIIHIFSSSSKRILPTSFSSEKDRNIQSTLAANNQSLFYIRNKLQISAFSSLVAGRLLNCKPPLGCHSSKDTATWISLPQALSADFLGA